MADENKTCASTLGGDSGQGPTKKPTVIKRILKWFGVGVLGVLIILGLIFQVPWKVIAILVVFLLAHTVLPRRGVKWFWAGVGVVVVALVIWVFLPEADGDWRPYTFDKELAALEAKRAIPDEENAATIYNELLKDYNINVCPIDPNADVQLLLPIREPWKSSEHPRLARWLEDKQGEIAKIVEASEIDKCRFPIEVDITQSTNEMVRLGAMRRWAYWLVTMANNDRGEGRIDEALRKEIAVLRIAHHQYQQPTMVNYLVGIAIESVGIQQVKRVVVTGDGGEEYLKTVEKALSEIGGDWAGNLPRVLEFEKLLAKNLWGMFYVVNPEGRIRLNPGIAIRAMIARLSEDTKKEIEDKAALTCWRRKLMKAHTVLAWFYMPSSPQKAGQVVDAAYERYFAMVEPGYDWEKEPEETAKIPRLNYTYLVEHLIEVLAPAYQRIHEVYLRVKSDKQGCRIMVALRRCKNKTGHWPQSLDEVRHLVPEEIFIDPLNNGSFVYKLSDENFTLYSKGENGIDDGGMGDEESGADDRPIWPL